MRGIPAREVRRLASNPEPLIALAGGTFGPVVGLEVAIAFVDIDVGDGRTQAGGCWESGSGTKGQPSESDSKEPL